MVVPSADVVFSTSISPAVASCRRRDCRAASNSSTPRPMWFRKDGQQVGDGQDGEEDDQEQEGQGHGAPPGWFGPTVGPAAVGRLGVRGEAPLRFVDCWKWDAPDGPVRANS